MCNVLIILDILNSLFTFNKIFILRVQTVLSPRPLSMGFRYVVCYLFVDCLKNQNLEFTTRVFKRQSRVFQALV